jgi:hypothetical protein
VLPLLGKALGVRRCVLPCVAAIHEYLAGDVHRYVADPELTCDIAQGKVTAKDDKRLDDLADVARRKGGTSAARSTQRNWETPGTIASPKTE